MNVTPLVDVVLVLLTIFMLLIIFMVITPLMAQQFWIHVPNQYDKGEPADPNPNDGPIVVSLTTAGEIKIGRVRQGRARDGRCTRGGASTIAVPIALPRI